MTLISIWRVRIEPRFSVRRFTTVTAQTVGLIKHTVISCWIYSHHYRTNSLQAHHCAVMKPTRRATLISVRTELHATRVTFSWAFLCYNSHFEGKDQWLHSSERKRIEIELLMRHAEAQLSYFIKTIGRKTHCCECFDTKWPAAQNSHTAKSPVLKS